MDTGSRLSSEVFEFSLLYHPFLSAVFFLTDASLAFARAVQVGLGSLTCLLLALITARVGTAGAPACWPGCWPRCTHPQWC